MESKFDETKNNVLQSKYPPDIIGFCETIFHENISNDSLNINGLSNEMALLSSDSSLSIHSTSSLGFL
jgi:hypothetical protein